MKTFETEQKFGKKLEHIEYFIQVGFYKTQVQWKHNKFFWKHCDNEWRWTNTCKGQRGEQIYAKVRMDILIKQFFEINRVWVYLNVFNKYWMLMWFLTSVECKCELNATEGFVWSWSSVKHSCRPEEKLMNV